MATPPIPVSALRDPWVFVATGFGAGLIRPAPGTWGTVAGLPFVWGLALLPLPVSVALVVLAAVVGVPICGRAGERLGMKDHGGIVWDEMVGIWLTLVLLPFDWVTVLVGFAAFRAFDILKPWPVSWADREVDGGLGVMLDDLIAGVLAGVATFVLVSAVRLLLP